MNHSTMRTYFKIIFLLVLFTTGLHSQQDSLLEKYDNYQELSYEGLNYGLFTPVNYDTKKSYPLLVYLHGYTDTTSWDLGWYQESFQAENPCFVLTPKNPGGPRDSTSWGDSWQGFYTDVIKKTLEVFDSLIVNYSINTNRLYIYGASMGGFGTLFVLSKQPGRFAAAYVVCGGGNIEFADKVMQTPLWMFHGELDDRMPIAQSKDLYNEMLQQGAKEVRYTEYPGVKHNSWENVAQERTLKKWLFAQEKDLSHSPPISITQLTAGRVDGKMVLNWVVPAKSTNPDNEVWYYKVFRNDTLIAEIDGDQNSFSDENFIEGGSYYLVALNYFFKESKPSQVVSIQ